MCAASIRPSHPIQYIEVASALSGYGGDRIRSRVPGGDHVFHDDDGDTGLEAAFDTPTRAVAFRLLADREGVELLPLGPGGGGNGVGDRIGAEDRKSVV